MARLGYRQVYDLLLMGLFWLGDTEKAQSQRRSISPVLYALRELGLLTENERKSLRKDQYFAGLVLGKTEVFRECFDLDRLETKNRELIATGSQHLVMIVSGYSETSMDRTKVLGPNGYRFLVTRVGAQYVADVAPGYAHLLNKERFLTAHRIQREKAGIITSAQRVHQKVASLSDNA
jgi:hypothetical protein